jgi:two-component system sensor histidine kinase TctE
MASAREQRSLFGEILDWMLAPLLVLWPMSVALTWLVAQSIANRPYDRDLGDLARALGTQVQAEVEVADRPVPAVSAALSRTAAGMLRPDDEDSIFFQVLGLRGELIAGDTALPVPMADASVAPGELRFRDDEIGGESVRVAYLWLPKPGAPAELSGRRLGPQ